jgi:CRISPR/Cas system-associated exonuclease Cas4 (RecB family)
MKIEYHDGEVVEMLFDSKLHSYKVGKEVVPNATKILDIISKPALVPWALKVGGDWLEKNFFFDQEASSKKTSVYKSRMALEPLLKGMKGAYRGVSRDALNIGSLTHEWVEAAINWKIAEGEIPKMPKQEEAVNAIHAFQDWVGENVVEWKSAEEKIYHRKYKYAGTVDARAIINGEYCVIDWKTSKRVYPEYYLQVAAYAKAVEDMHGIPVDATYILRCDKASGKFEAVRSTEIEENFQAFLAAKTLKQRLKNIK